MNGRAQRLGALIWVFAVLSGAIAPRAHVHAALPWWDDYPLIALTDSVGVAVDLNATVAYQVGGLSCPGWGVYGAAVLNTPQLVAEAHAAGLKSIGYYEAFGQNQCVLVELGNRLPGGITPLVTTHWSWENYNGGPIQWMSAHNWFDDEEFARPYTRTHPTYGGPPMTYPDGTIATGYDGDPSNPFNSRVHDAGCAKNVLGEITFGFEPSNDMVQQNGPYDGLLQFDGVYTGLISFSKDSACPMWIDLEFATTRRAAELGLDGRYNDNTSSWDSFWNWAPVTAAFGEWSIARFRDYLAENFTAQEQAAMGVTDLATFDVRAALRAQAAAWGGNDADLYDPVWLDARWLDHPLWRAYVIFKRQTGTEALTDYYNAVKQAALNAGNADFGFCGNDIPNVTLGWARDNVDFTATEVYPSARPESGPRGYGLPPFGRFTPYYKLGAEHTRGRFNTYWMLFGDPYDGYVGGAGIATVLFYEMLASHSTPTPWLDHPLHAGTLESYRDFYGFVSSVKPVFADRSSTEEVGVYYSSSSLLAYMTPGGLLDWASQPHQFAIWGWGTALGELHYQYRFLPEWKLDAATLAGLRVLIIPDAEVFDPADEALVESWVQDGGLLIVTGNSGLRFGEGGNFEINAGGLSLAPLTGVSSMTPPPTEDLRTVGAGKVLFIPDNIGMEYFQEDTQRNVLRANFSDAMAQVLQGAEPLLIAAPAVPTTVGLTLYRDAHWRRQFVDVNNFDIDLPMDAVQPAGPIVFDVALPAWLDASQLDVYGVSPGGGGFGGV